ncbi:DapH/DapD/GlmU-related protein [Paraprevotella xylaniphila]|uniref:DapH/DapD/GlmU-related protein n=1 Tax=Paraprevotella xylaniphila TaxID=454155 RepID=UPI0026DC9909|nr:DapH/DapD/GlmU-related protein [Paraprevotella xylaniphila]
MGRIKNWIVKFGSAILKKFEYRYNQIMSKSIRLGYRGVGSIFEYPSVIGNPSQVYLHDYSRLQRYHKILNYTGKFVMKEYSEAAINLTVVTGNHTPTVGVPQYLLAPSHVNDHEMDVIVEEDVWLGTNVTLIAGAHIGRGAVVGAGSIVNKDIPPYAIVVGVPARIVGVKFTVGQILEHEQVLYPENKRFSKDYLESLFERYFDGKKVLGKGGEISQEDKDRLRKVVEDTHFRYVK